MNLIKSIGAILAGAIIGAILSVGMDWLLQQLGFPPSNTASMLALALLYRLVFNVVGGYITAKLAPRNRMGLVIILGVAGTLVTLLGTITNWDLSAHWYPVLLTILTFPTVYLGGKLAVRQN